MLKELKFVQGAVAKKDFLPAMTHFRIENGEVRSYNGKMAISSPINFNVDCNPKAEQLVKAITQCEETITLSITPGGKLRVQSGKFRAFVELIEGDTPHPMPEGQDVYFDGEIFMKGLRTVAPFIGNDASRLWANGVLIRNQSMFATNNASLIEYWMESTFPVVCNVPGPCVTELLRVNEAPTHAQIHDRSITFHFEGGRWIRSQLFETEWPDLAKILNVPSNAQPVPEDLFKAIDTLKKATAGTTKLYFNNGLLMTDLEEQKGMTYEVDGLEFTGCYNIHMLSLLAGVVTHADFTLYPEPAMFFGAPDEKGVQHVRGAILGMRM